MRDDIEGVQRSVRAAILADSTRDISGLSGEAMAQIDALLFSLKNLPATDSNGVEPALVRAAQRALEQAWTYSERVGLGSSVPEMRAALVDCKTFVDYAEAYAAASLGVEFAE
jgi:hypothetical protein